MSASLEMSLRTSSSYDTAHKAVNELKALGAWPTPLNYELGLYYINDPDGPLAQAIQKIVADGLLSSDDWSDRLAREFLPRLIQQDQLEDAGAILAKQLDNVSTTLSEAAATNSETSSTLQQVERGIRGASPERLQELVLTASSALQAANAKTDTYKAQFADSVQEVERLRDQLDRVRREAMTDPLTSLPNRRAFDQDLERACTAVRSTPGSVFLALIDIDHFKVFNDTWGHQTGDQVIRLIATLLKIAASPPRVAARFGGEEFVLLFPHTNERDAMTIVERLRSETARRELKSRITGEALGRVTVSIGLAERHPSEASADLISRADAALYQSKREGRNRTTLAAPPPKA